MFGVWHPVFFPPARCPPEGLSLSTLHTLTEGRLTVNVFFKKKKREGRRGLERGYVLFVIPPHPLPLTPRLSILLLLLLFFLFKLVVLVGLRRLPGVNLGLVDGAN